MEKIKTFFNNSIKIEIITDSSESESSSDSEESRMSPIGFIEPYADGMSIQEYLERFEAYLALQKVVDDKEKTVVLIGVSGALLYSKLKSVCAPVGPASKKYSEIKPLLISALSPASLEVVERAKFFTRTQNSGENASSFSLALRQLAQTCNFGEQLDSNLRDRFIMGLNNEEMKRSIINANPDTLAKAISLAQTSEISNNVSVNDASGIYRFNTNSGSRGRQIQRTTFSHARNYVPRSTHSYARNQSNEANNAEQPRGFGNRNFGNRGGGRRRYRAGRCYECGDRDHYADRCPYVQRLGSVGDDESGFNQEVNVNQLGKFPLQNSLIVQTDPPLLISIKINGIDLVCEVDTGASMSVISNFTYEKYFNDCELYAIRNKIFTMADDTRCNVVGAINVRVGHGTITQALVLNTLRERPPLIGRTWLNILFPNWKCLLREKMLGIDLVSEIVDEDVIVLRKEFEKCFQPHSNPISDFKVHLRLKEGARPQFRKPSTIPFKLKDQVREKFRDMLERDIVKKVVYSDWASQIVLADKKDGTVRVCCNYKPTLNPWLEGNGYPIPKIDEILFTLNGNKYFSVIDLSGAYLQLELDEESQQLTTVNTPWGLFSYKRLAFGIKTAPAIFQEVMDKILNGLVGVVSYFDDILIGAPSRSECVARTRAVLNRLSKYNVQANFEKCVFFKTEIDYLGHHVSEKGVSPTTKKVKAIQEASSPRDVTSLRSFLGLLNYYSKFLPNLQGRLQPLHELLKHNARFVWSNECERIFTECKQAILGSPILSFYDPRKPLTLVCDAGPYGVGAILNVVENGRERPVYMESASLSVAERNYSQYDREALAIVFGMKKFHKFVYGIRITIFTDCKPLIPILSQKKDLGSVINSRFLRWLLFLQNYDFEIRHRPKKFTGNADALSRLPTSQTTGIEELSLNIDTCLNSFNESQDALINQRVIEKEIQRNKICSELFAYITNGWPNKDKVHEKLLLFYKFRLSLSVQDGCIFYGDRLYIPPSYRGNVLRNLHSEHKGVVKSKQLARRSIWWPCLDKDIENYISNCSVCQTFANSRNTYVEMSWPKTTYPFERIHIDHFFFDGKCFLIIVDDFSNYIDVQLNRSVDSKSVLRSLRNFFSIFGLPTTIVSDNATCFNSIEFNEFCKFNGITHLNSPQYHPQSNGLAERGVGIVKSNLKKCLNERKADIETQLTNFLFDYRFSPLCGSDVTPAEKIFSFKAQTNFSCLSKQAHTRFLNPEKLFKAAGQDQRRRTISNWKPAIQTSPNFVAGSLIFYYFKIKKIWVEAVVIRRVSELLYEIKFKSGKKLVAHIRDLKSRDRKKLSFEKEMVEINRDEKDDRSKANDVRNFYQYNYNSDDDSNSQGHVTSGGSEEEVKSSSGHSMVLRPRKNVK